MPLTTKQLKDLREGIGGSEAGTVCGLNQFKSAYQLWLEKTGQLEPDDISEKPSVVAGNYFEPAIAKWFSDTHEVKLERINTTWRNKQYPFILSHPDRRVLNAKAIAEIKFVTFRMAHLWGPTGTDQIPDIVMCQAQHQMFTSNGNVDLCYVIAVLECADWRVYPIERDNAFIQDLVEVEREFKDRVDQRINPGIDFENPKVIEVLQRLYPNTNGEIIKLTDIYETYTARYKRLGEVGNRIDKEQKSIKARMLDAIGPNYAGELPDGSLWRRKWTEKKAQEPTAYMELRHVKAPKTTELKRIESI